jgi:hypothetical protein
MRFQIDEHREELKEAKFIQISLEMIDETKKYETKMYLKNLKEKLFETAPLDQTKHLLTSELIEIEETCTATSILLLLLCLLPYKVTILRKMRRKFGSCKSFLTKFYFILLGHFSSKVLGKTEAICGSYFNKL